MKPILIPRARTLSPGVEAALPEHRRTGAPSNSLRISSATRAQAKMEAAPVRLRSQRAASTPQYDWLRLCCVLLMSASCALLPVAQAAEPVEVKIGVLPGLKFDVQRFAVAPGSE